MLRKVGWGVGVQDNVFFYDVSAVGSITTANSFNDMSRLFCVTLWKCRDTGDRRCMFQSNLGMFV